MERLRNPYSGLGQYCLQLGQALAAQTAPAFQFAYLLPAGFVGTFGEKTVYRVVRKTHRWCPPRLNATLWHCTHQDSAYWPGERKTTAAITLHDLNFLERADYSSFKKKIKLAALQRRVNRCKGIVYISEFVRGLAQGNLKIPVGTVEHVIYNGNNLSEKTPAASRPEWQGWKPFLFSIGIHPKKNYHVLLPLLQAFGQYRWVIAGADGRGYRGELERQAARLGVADRLIFTGPVTDAEKKWLFEQSLALLFPSLSEGFGLPVVEAMSCGKPVFLSTRTSLPEVGGLEAYYFTDFDPASVHEVFKKGMADFEKNPEKIQRLKSRAQQFNWADAATCYQQFYQNVIES
jgi:glycosyltransferase involved in cell wall biosynthesis